MVESGVRGVGKHTVLEDRAAASNFFFASDAMGSRYVCLVEVAVIQGLIKEVFLPVPLPVFLRCCVSS